MDDNNRNINKPPAASKPNKPNKPKKANNTDINKNHSDKIENDEDDNYIFGTDDDNNNNNDSDINSKNDNNSQLSNIYNKSRLNKCTGIISNSDGNNEVLPINVKKKKNRSYRKYHSKRSNNNNINNNKMNERVTKIENMLDKMMPYIETMVKQQKQIIDNNNNNTDKVKEDIINTNEIEILETNINKNTDNSNNEELKEFI